MDSLAKNSHQTSRGFNYTYYFSPANAGKPTLLLVHGWPDRAALWEDLAINHLVPAGYGVVIPDCLGYEGSAKPTDPSAYSWNLMVDDVCELLDASSVDKVISLGHDWGSGLAMRFCNFRPERCTGLITLNVAYLPRSAGPMDLEAIRLPIEKARGFFPLWYWYLFIDPVDGPQILEANLNGLFELLHASPDRWLDTLCAKDGVKNFLLEGRTEETLPYATEAMKQTFISRFSRDGFAAPLCWYRAMVDGVQYQAEMTLPAKNFFVNVPYLYIPGLKEVIDQRAQIDEPRQLGLLPDLTIQGVDAGHWSMLSNPKAVGDIIAKWLGDKF
jgi:soluble epoxide hydrolase/lipid-phosphate phosphatase